MSCGTFFRGDAKDALACIDQGSAKLVYVDPPFAVKKVFRARPEAGAEGVVRERAKGPRAYDDTWPSMDAYLGWLVPRLALAFRALDERGTMWVHLDHHAVREVQHALASAFGRDTFAGEIVWVPGNGKKAKRGVPHAHQTILVYKKRDDHTWNEKAKEARVPYADTSLSMHFTHKDDAGRAYRDRTVGKKTYRYYADEGRAVGSVWTDCPAMLANTPLRSETTGYPTQKPEKLLARIVALATDAGDLVVDPFCGSGTTLSVACAMGRRFFGSDIGEISERTVRTRLERAGADATFLAAP